MTFPTYGAGFCLGLAMEKWFTYYGYPDSTKWPAIVCTVLAAAFAIWATYPRGVES